MYSSTLRRFSQRLTVFQLNSAATSSIRTPHVYDQTATIPEVRKIHTNTLSSVLSADVRTYRSSTASSSKNPLNLCGSSSGTGKPSFLSLHRDANAHFTHRYKAFRATWEPPQDHGEGERFIEEFELAAEIEGRDLSNPEKAVVLNEAAAAGWG